MQKVTWISRNSSTTTSVFLNRRSDDALITVSSSAKASHFWEGQIHVAVKDRALCFLFESTGLKFHGKGFEMLAVLNQHCRPDSVANAFTTLPSPFWNFALVSMAR
jgi:hypothetical protein